MNAHVLVLVFVGLIAAGFIIAICWEGRKIKQVEQAVFVYDEDAQRWMVRPEWIAPAPEPAPVRAVIDLEPGIDLGLRDDCELLFSMPAFERPADHTTTTTEGGDC